MGEGCTYHPRETDHLPRGNILLYVKGWDQSNSSVTTVAV